MKQDNFIYLLVALIIFLVVLPVSYDLQLISHEVSRPIAYTCLLAIGVWSMRDSIKTFRTGMALAAIGIITNGIATANDAPVFYYLSFAAMFVFLLLAIRSALRQVVFSTDINSNRLFGAVCVYLMLGVLWALMYSALGELDPDAFTGALPIDNKKWSLDWFYYSFVTLTTLGYGDILPVSATARALAYGEAVVGVFYMAMLVAALVGSYAAANTNKD
jgi:voltage-gated potassium channel